MVAMNWTGRTYFLTCLLLFIAMFSGSGQSKEQQNLEARKTQLLNEIKQINSLLNQQAKKRTSILSQVEDLNQKIRMQQELIRVTNQQANLLNRQINGNMRKIESLRNDLVKLKEDYAKMIVRSYKSKSQQSRLMFLLSSETFLQGYKRLQYMKQYTNFRKEQGVEIQKKTEELQQLNTTLIVQRKEKERLVAENRKAQQELQTERLQQEQLVNSIRKKEGEYASQIKQKRSQADELDRQIQKLIREAIAESNKKAGAKATGGSATTFALTPEGRLIANNFAANKGSLIWPVERGYKSQGYGQYADPVYPDVKHNNNGVTIATIQGAKARAIFDGEISAIIAIPGGNKAVQVRHGNYITTYYNLSDVYVRKGEKVKAKQSLGAIVTNPITGKTEMKFFLYKDTVKLNPEQWIAKM